MIRHADIAKRKATTLVVALIGLLVVVMFMGAVIRSLLFQHRMTRIEEKQVQSFWLAESALAKAIVQCQLNRDYEGESWQVEIAHDDEAQTGVAIIRVKPGNIPTEKHIEVEAHWPDDPLQRVVSVQSFTLNLPETGEMP